MYVRKCLVWLVALGLFGVTVADEPKVDPALPDYVSVEGVAGTIKSAGSDTMVNLMTHWGEGFKKFYPAVGVEIEGKGSSSAPAALIEGTANFGAMSRKMMNKELDTFQQKFGYKPTELGAAIDMLAVFVHRDNPIEGLTLPQVDAIFSRTRKGGFPHDVKTWDQLGLNDRPGRPIVLYGRNAISGTYGYFKEVALFNGDFKDTVKEQPGSSSVVQGVATEANAIGYSGIGYITAGVRAVPLAEKPGEPFIAPTQDKQDDYPITPQLNVCINLQPGTQLDPLRREFLRYIYSKHGQMQVVKDGYMPISADAARETLKRVGIE